jgi:DNA-directed RNA polymerase subunit RPC12/RpoP
MNNINTIIPMSGIFVNGNWAVSGECAVDWAKYNNRSMFKLIKCEYCGFQKEKGWSLEKFVYKCDSCGANLKE